MQLYLSTDLLREATDGEITAENANGRHMPALYQPPQMHFTLIELKQILLDDAKTSKFTYCRFPSNSFKNEAARDFQFFVKRTCKN